MPQPPLTSEQIAEAVAAVERYGSQNAAADALGLSRGALQNRLRAPAKVPAQAARHMERVGGDPSQIAGGWLMEYDDDGRKLGSHRYRVDPLDTLAERIAEVLAGIREPLPPVELTREPESDFLNMLALPDIHFLMQAWGKETGQDYDLKVARRDVMTAACSDRARIAPCLGSARAQWRPASALWNFAPSSSARIAALRSTASGILSDQRPAASPHP